MADSSNWHRQFGVLEILKTYYRIPYCKAVAPFVAGALDLAGVERPRLLVIGGGNGHFSRELFPAVIKILQSVSSIRHVEVVESDEDPHLRQAIPGAVITDVRHLSDVFPQGSFQAVVGESMIHHLAQDIPLALDQIRRVLVPGGVFIHVQDAIPDPRVWLSGKTKATGVLEILQKEEARLTLPQFVFPEVMEMREHVMKECHDRLADALVVSAKRVGLKIGMTTVHGFHDQRETRSDHPAGIGGNWHNYAFGTQYYREHPDLEPGIRRREYRGMVAVVSQRPMADFERHLNAKNFEYRP